MSFKFSVCLEHSFIVKNVDNYVGAPIRALVKRGEGGAEGNEIGFCLFFNLVCNWCELLKSIVFGEISFSLLEKYAYCMI